MKTPRRRARELAVQALYQAGLNQTAAPEVAKNIRELPDFEKADEELFTKLFFGAHSNAAEHMAHIRPLLDRDEKDLSPIERAVLLMACHELSAMPETPYPVIINEAIEVTKTFGGTDGHKFVNGILDRLAVQLRPNDPKRA
ncbi:transcription antitermination factor NusB [Bergeriella denitrificans]|uniref:Transcription antitermination protein NusB n=1 Tax=Bergeriella denitrificans TaxID=494 RepID=A0A378UH81_BERDE|nr:transcription antitermination factor NusB [Bergeriella denitrificans]STZ76676.1 transcription antitermination protein NusB [Bergeriella denitrificans]